VKSLTWIDDNLLRQVAYEGLREDKATTEGAPPSAAREPVIQDRPDDTR
jgi:hypothetical protein